MKTCQNRECNAAIKNIRAQSADIVMIDVRIKQPI
jgi:hypothetical protein